MSGPSRWHLVLVVALGASGCAARAASADLQYGFTVASQRARLAEAAVEDLQDRVVAVEDVLREQGLDRASGMQTMQQLTQELAALRGEIEVVQFQLKELRADVDQFRMDHERRSLHAEARLAQVEKLLGVSAPPPPSLDTATGFVSIPADDATARQEAPAPAPAPDAPAEDASFEDRLALAEARMEEGQQAVARAILEQAISREPSHPNVAEAEYRLAETWFNEGKWREAARRFQVVTDEHAKSPWASWAMLRIGECFDGMGRKDAARTFYDGVVRNFPGSDAAKEARRLLE